NSTMAGDIQFRDGKCYFICSNPKIHNWFQVSNPDPEQDGKKVILKVTNWGSKLLSINPVGKVEEILGESGNPEVEVLAVIRQYDLPLEFSEEVSAEVQSLSDQLFASDVLIRKDLRSLYTFTIDPASAKDFDDAISIIPYEKGWKLYVHIADVAHYVKPGSKLFDEAVNRGNSYYFPKRVIPMLPERISNKLCSLRPEEDKLTLTVYSEIDSRGKIIKQSIFESIINSNMRLSYEEVDDFFAGTSSSLPESLQVALTQALELSKLLTRKRMDAGYIFFDLPEIEYQYDDEGFIHHFTLAEETESHKLIENFMLVANEFVARKLSQLSPTSLYRIHEDPDWQKIEKLAEILSNYGLVLSQQNNLNKALQALLYSMPSKDYHIVFDRMILRSLKKAKYSVEHLRHFGLAIEDYTHFTSPIRRLCDLVIHHLCKSYLIKSSKLNFGFEQLKHYAAIASEKEIVADNSERDVERVYNLTYMKKQIGQSYTGIIISMKSSGLVIRLYEIPITGVHKLVSGRDGRWIFLDKEMRIVNKKTGFYYQLMDKVKVQVMQVSDDIYFELDQDHIDSHRNISDIKINAKNVSYKQTKKSGSKTNFRHKGKRTR
ncbi:MAG: VacB/RNase II family 3'-5' exoribonuclease, partial [Candidatus Cloacimonetes bacterium]|nr:VacB/RNase II family 3'-5' exoribonuclease [Candidatus Cloacimonadota bacterium]